MPQVDDYRPRTPESGTLGFTKKHQSLISDALEHQNGLVLFCGPANAGKDTSATSFADDIPPIDRLVRNLADAPTGGHADTLEWAETRMPMYSLSQR